MKRVLAFDFGASGGRAILARLERETMQLTEVHRFSNEPEHIGNAYYWDIVRLWHEIKTGLSLGWAAGGFDSIGIDTWGVDFGLLGPGGELLGMPRHYRDDRNEEAARHVLAEISAGELYRETGIQYQPFNTIFQLRAIQEREPWLLEQAQHLLLLPDLFAWMLTGQRHTDFTNASTTGLLEAGQAQWNRALLQRLGLPERIFGPIQCPGTEIGTLLPELCEELKLPPIPVFSVASHDTASAVVAVPAVDEGAFVYISCGTWSLFGTELGEPVVSEEALRENFTNEGGADGKTRFLKNIMGLWLIQQSRRHWNRHGGSYSYDDLEEKARQCQPFQSLIDGDDPMFYPPGDMPSRVQEYCRRTGQIVPETVGEIMRCLYDSIALKYRITLDGLERLTGKTYAAIHMVGGGVQDHLLPQLAANVCGVPVAAGPIEATAAGNAAMQWIAWKELRDIEQARRVVRDSFPLQIFEPHPTPAAEEAVRRYRILLAHKRAD